jgi:hypothetical protein
VNTYSRWPDACVAGLCNIDQAAREKAKEFEDLRGAFADPGIDAVSIATLSQGAVLQAPPFDRHKEDSAVPPGAGRPRVAQERVRQWRQVCV